MPLLPLVSLVWRKREEGVSDAFAEEESSIEVGFSICDCLTSVALVSQTDKAQFEPLVQIKITRLLDIL